jgi:hypothetical protein
MSFLPLSGGTMTGNIVMSSHAITSLGNLAVSGSTGATTSTRYVGGTTSGAPTSGTFSTGDYVVTTIGNIYICTSGGTPGTWVVANSSTFVKNTGGTIIGSLVLQGTLTMSGGPVINATYSGVAGITGATVASRYVGGTNANPPTTGGFSAGDYVVSRDGNMYVCTATGFPGTWQASGSTYYLPKAGGTMTGTINMNSNQMTNVGGIGMVMSSGGSIAMNNNAITGVSCLTVSGLTGATTSSRYVGGTASGAPLSGNFLIGDYIISQNGNLYVCTASGNPGTWSNGFVGSYLPLAGGTMAGTINMNGNVISNIGNLSVNGLTGATTVSRYAGGTTSGAPVSGTFNAGDYIISRDGNVYLCILSGTPGSWQKTGMNTFLPLTGGVMAGTLNVNSNMLTNVGGLTMTGPFNMTNNSITGAASVALSGLSGAGTASRYVGGTVNGAPTSGTFTLGDYVVSQNGNLYVCKVSGSPGTWSQDGSGTFLPLSGGTMTGTLNMGSNAITGVVGLTMTGTLTCGAINTSGAAITGVSQLALSGLTGATVASRYVGGTSSIAPTTGTFSAGDYVISRNGAIWVCNTGGSPGNWTQSGSGTFLPLSGGVMSGTLNMGGNQVTNASFLSVNGDATITGSLTGATSLSASYLSASGIGNSTSASRYVGATASVAPTSGAYSTGDFVIAQSGNVWICTSGGSPGTWVKSGAGVYLPLAGGTMAGSIAMGNNSVTGVNQLISTRYTCSGYPTSNTVSDWVGGTAHDAPQSGTYSAGNFIVSLDGNIYICTSSGSPGTWVKQGAGVYLPLAGGVMSGNINCNGNNLNNTGTISGANGYVQYVDALYSPGAAASNGGMYWNSAGKMGFNGGDNTSFWSVIGGSGEAMFKVYNQTSGSTGSSVQTYRNTLDDGKGNVTIAGTSNLQNNLRLTTKVTLYKNVNTVGGGVPALWASTASSTGPVEISTTFGNILRFSPPTNGQYRVTVSVVCYNNPSTLTSLVVSYADTFVNVTQQLANNVSCSLRNAYTFTALCDVITGTYLSLDGQASIPTSLYASAIFEVL